MKFSGLIAILQETAPAPDNSSQVSTLRIVAGVLLVVILAVIIMRRRGGGKKKEEEEF